MILGIETSTAVCGAALIRDGLLVGAEMSRARSVHSERLMPMVQRLLNHAGGTFADLKAVAVSAGPGSYTGLRIGMATAKGLCVSTGASLVPVPTLEALASAAGLPERPVCAIMAARRSEVYAAVYGPPSDGIPCILAPQPIELENLLKRLPDAVCLTGPGIRDHAERLRAWAGAGIRFASELVMDPSAQAVASLGELRLARGLTASPVDAEPYYLKNSQVQRPSRST